MTTILLHFQAANESTLSSLVTTLKNLQDAYRDYLWCDLDVDEPLIDSLAGGVGDHNIICYGSGFILQLLIDSGFWCWYQQIWEGESDATNYKLLCTSNLEITLGNPMLHQYAYPNRFQQSIQGRF
jgi:hypothetical protein